ncbi:ArsR/SmtB family transcription factor [Salinicoccus halodurans]|uniref:ArsR family transcriptional regulator n=1 Tax=Salinicoccus halodurans TaxID=407035 RepID=A0A0F7HP20_9STAP|nr:metalloregulator ArsR/SmtB family transcription factor [Salinicoccus halodurans]AKG74863.1 ArsR family transcriptional regulator [Salinicoccus halodurans]SFK69300.1 cadmium-sensing regulator, CadC [Salinicoccus halodurans]
MTEANHVCEVESVDAEKVNHAKEFIDTEAVVKVAAIFKALGDANRARIVRALSIEDELCVCDLANIMEVSTASASHHLRSLSRQGVTKSRKMGKMVYYSLDDDHIKQIVDMAFIHQEELNGNVK